VDIIENGYRMITEPERSGETISDVEHLVEGHTLLKIQRFGPGKETRYHVTLA
jgi:hypothetical protein